MSIFKNITKLITCIGLTSCLILPFSFSAYSTPKNISILQLVEHPALNATREGLIEELKVLGYVEGESVIIDFQSAQGNPTLAAQIAQKFVSNKPDIIVAIPTLAAQAALSAAKNSDVPIVFSSVTDPKAAKLVTNLKAPEGHITGVSNFIAVEPQFAFFRKILPSLKKIGVIYNPGEANSIALNKIMEEEAKKMGMEIVLAPASKSSEVFAATQSLCEQVDAVFVNNDNTALSAFQSVVKAAKACDIPALVSDLDIADQGAKAALGPDQRDIGRQTARMVHSILKNPGAKLPAVEFPKKTQEFVANP